MRLDRLVSDRAGCSRRIAGAAIRRGRVTVAGQVVRDPSAHVSVDDVALDDEALPAPPELALFHKPLGVHSVVR
ncbi:MAG: S4 domain-containing protein, partial [Myxococcota bacterium]